MYSCTHSFFSYASAGSIAGECHPCSDNLVYYHLMEMLGKKKGLKKRFEKVHRGLPCGYFKVSQGLLILTLTSFFETLALRFCLLNIVLIICEMLAVWALVTVWFSPVFFSLTYEHTPGGPKGPGGPGKGPGGGPLRSLSQVGEIEPLSE